MNLASQPAQQKHTLTQQTRISRLLLYAALVLIGLLSSVLAVIMTAFVRYATLARWQAAIRYAWMDASICNQTDLGTEWNTRCTLRENDTLAPPLDGAWSTQVLEHATAVYLLDLVVRIRLRADEADVADVRLVPPGHELLALYHNEPDEPAFAALYRVTAQPQLLILACRATRTHHEIQDDLNAWQVYWRTGERVSHPTDTFVVDEAFIHGTEPQVHSGFFATFQRFRTAVRARVEQENATTLLCTGHSLGGAVATLAACDLGEWLSGRCAVGMCVFGTPRVGNGAFHDLLMSVCPDRGTWVVNNEVDLIASLPVHVMPNLKTPSEHPFYYTHAGQRHTFTLNWGSWEQNHGLALYAHHLRSFG